MDQMDEPTFTVLKVEDVAPNEAGTFFKFTFVMDGAPDVRLAIPSHQLFRLAAVAFVAANQAHAIAGTLANQQILRTEDVEIHSSGDRFDLHFRLTGTATDLPVGMSRQTAQTLLKRLAAFLAPGSIAPNAPRQ